MKFNLPPNLVSPYVMILLWIFYLVIYWRALFQILSGRFLNTQEKILWFLVITLAPVIGIITYWMILTPERRREERAPD